MPKLYIISGCNGSGKPTASYSLLPQMLGCTEFVNSDEFAKYLSPFDPSAASISASRYMLMKIRYLLERNSDFCIETTLATRTLLKTIRKAREENGYEVTLIYFWLNSPELAIKRVRDRVEAGGHHIPDEVVKRRYYMGIQYFFDDYLPVCDKWILADNSTSPFTIIAEGDKRLVSIKDSTKYEYIWGSVHEDNDPEEEI